MKWFTNIPKNNSFFPSYTYTDENTLLNVVKIILYRQFGENILSLESNIEKIQIKESKAKFVNANIIE